MSHVQVNISGISAALLEKLRDDAAKPYVTKCSTIFLYLTKLYVTYSFAIASSVTYSEIRQHFSDSARVWITDIGSETCWRAGIGLGCIGYTIPLLPGGQGARTQFSLRNT